jgi:hypothetical protein
MTFESLFETLVREALIEHLFEGLAAWQGQTRALGQPATATHRAPVIAPQAASA